MAKLAAERQEKLTANGFSWTPRLDKKAQVSPTCTFDHSENRRQALHSPSVYACNDKFDLY